MGGQEDADLGSDVDADDVVMPSLAMPEFVMPEPAEAALPDAGSFATEVHSPERFAPVADAALQRSDAAVSTGQPPSYAQAPSSTQTQTQTRSKPNATTRRRSFRIRRRVAVRLARTHALVLVAGVLAGALTASAVIAVASSTAAALDEPSTPEELATAYMSAYVQGDAETMNAMVPVDSMEGASVSFLTDAVVASAARAPSYELGRPRVEGDRASVHVTVPHSLGSIEVFDLDLVREGGRWRIEESLAVLAVVRDIGGTTRSFGGVALSPAQQRGEEALLLYPGDYPIDSEAEESTWFSTVSTSTIPFLGTGDSSVEIGTSSWPTADLEERFAAEVTAFLSECAHAGGDGCPQRGVEWNLDRHSMWSFDEAENGGPSTVMATANGTAGQQTDIAIAYDIDGSGDPVIVSIASVEQ